VPITVGANICIQPLYNAFGQINGGTVTLAASTNLTVCGTVVSYTPATGNFPGSIVINVGGTNTTYQISTGAVLSGQTITLGQNICLQAATNNAGQIIGGVVSTNTGTTVNVCGSVIGYTPASATQAGAITLVTGTTSSSFPIAVGAIFTGGALSLGANVCIQATINASGQISSGIVSVPLSAAPFFPQSGFVRVGYKYAG